MANLVIRWIDPDLNNAIVKNVKESNFQGQPCFIRKGTVSIPTQVM